MARFPKRRRVNYSPPPSPSSSSSSEDETSEPVNEDGTRRLKCPWRKCKTAVKDSTQLRCHYRRHSKLKPYVCIYPSCDHPGFNLKSHTIAHIIKKHNLSGKPEAKRHVKVLQKELDEETKLLGIRSHIRGEVFVEDVSDDDDHDNDVEDNEDESTDRTMIVLPRIDTIHRNPTTGHYICPFSGCTKEKISVAHLKIHYRTHCGNNFRPYQCIFDPATCQYTSKQRDAMKAHIRRVHKPEQLSSNPNTCDLDEFVQTYPDLLQIEEDLFSGVEIVHNGALELPRPFECPFENCSEQYFLQDRVFDHYLSHKKAKPFKCLFPKCGHTSLRKNCLQMHILAKHFNVPQKMQKDLITEQKLEADQYIEVLEDVLQQEQAAFAMAQEKKKQLINV